MDDLVRVINKLQEVTSLLGQDQLCLPQIVVVGDQSSGKSSVLESLVGQSFLPRGIGTVTRCPIILQLVRRDGDSMDDEDYGVFAHDKDTFFTDFGDIQSEIIAETIRKAGSKKDINPEPIILKIFSRKVTTLTLVDMPGIVKVPIGDQPSNVENIVKSLILHYISNCNSIILAVVPANTDMATCESLKIAKEVDPHFDRTIAVVTKLDLMDSGTDATEMLSGNVIPVKMGIVGVVNRSHLHTLNGKRITDAIIDETNYLKSVYPQIAHLHGIPSLARTLHKILLLRIENSIPQLQQRIKSSIVHFEYVLETLGDNVKDPKKLLLEILTKYSTSYCNKIMGTHNELETEELTGGARITYIFYETYGKTLDAVNPLDGLSKASIITALRNTSGVRPPFLIPVTCFELLVKKQIERLEAPSLVCVELIHDELKRIIVDVGPQLSTVMSRFPMLYNKIKTITSNLIKNRVLKTSEMVKNLVKIHCSYINTSHPDFIRDKADIFSDLKTADRQTAGLSVQGTSDALLQPSGVGDGFPRECILVERLIVSYFSIVQRSIKDTVPKAIMHFLVNHVMESLPSELVGELYRKVERNLLFEESQTVARERENIRKLLKTYENANHVINEIKESYYQ